MTTDWNDPDDTPLVRHVLYTNEVTGLMSAIVGALLLRCRPERLKAALEAILANWDERVSATRAFAEAHAEVVDEPSGWEDPPDERKLS